MSAEVQTGYDPVSKRSRETFVSPHGQKNNLMNKPSSMKVLSPRASMTSIMKKDTFKQENGKIDKIDRIKGILSSKTESELKLKQISDVVYGTNLSSALSEIVMNVE